MKKINLIFILIIFFAFSFSLEVIAADYTPEIVPVDVKKVKKEKSKSEKKFLKILKSKESKKDKKKEESKKAVKQSELTKVEKKTNKTVQAKTQQNYTAADVIIDSDYMEYYPEKSEIEAVGNAKVILTKDKTTLYADKIIFNHDLNNLKAYDNVKIVSEEATTTGDFINFDLNQDDGWLENPITENTAIKITAKEGYLLSDRIEEYDGVAKILENREIQFGSLSMDALVNPGNPNLGSAFKEETKEKGVYKIKAKTIYIQSGEEHNVLRMDNADIYLKKYKIASVPTITTVSNKEQFLLDTNFPEFGQVSELGMYAGPGFVFNLPRSSTLKISPILNYEDSKLGAGAVARFRHANNFTEVAYGSAADKFLVRGSQQLTENLQLDYNQYTLMDEWFMGPRRPRYATQLLYKTQTPIDDLNAVYSQRFSAGYYVDIKDQIRDGKQRYRWQAQLFKPFYSYKNEDHDLSLRLGAIAQTALSLYSTGDNASVVRAGPIVSTTFKRWSQDLMYFQTAWAGQSPFLFDQYMYGKSNVVFIENFKLHKNLSIGYLASCALLEDNYEEEMLQESRLLLSVGPEYARIIFGYDTKRKTTMMLFSMLVGTEGSEVKFKKAVLENPENISKKPDPLFDMTKIRYYRDKIFTPPEQHKSDKSKFEAVKESTEAMTVYPDNNNIPMIQPMMNPLYNQMNPGYNNIYY